MTAEREQVAHRARNTPPSRATPVRPKSRWRSSRERIELPRPDHFKAHTKDNHSRRGLLLMVESSAVRLLDYLKAAIGSALRRPDRWLGLRK